jgi:hypothetical protein
VYYLGQEDEDLRQPVPLDLKRGTGGYQFHALFRPGLPGNYEAIITYEEFEWVQPFKVIMHGIGYGWDKAQEKLTGKDKQNPDKPGASSQNGKSKGKSKGTHPGKGRGRNKP